MLDIPFHAYTVHRNIVGEIRLWGVGSHRSDRRCYGVDLCGRDLFGTCMAPRRGPQVCGPRLTRYIARTPEPLGDRSTDAVHPR